jgi:hypothetical protein
VILALLPAQHLASREPVAYDMHLEDVGWLWVTSDPAADGGGRTAIERAPGPRGRAERSFIVDGDAEGLARLVTYSPLRRRLARGVARVDGRRRLPEPLRALFEAPLSLEQLAAVGVVLPPALALGLLGSAIDPAWTAGERFTIGYETGHGHGDSATYLHVDDGRPIEVHDQPPLASVSTTVECVPERLFAVLAGNRPDVATIHGDPRPPALLASWIARAQGFAGAS